jgi:hypothetical protein
MCEERSRERLWRRRGIGAQSLLFLSAGIVTRRPKGRTESGIRRSPGAVRRAQCALGLLAASAGAAWGRHHVSSFCPHGAPVSIRAGCAGALHQGCIMTADMDARNRRSGPRTGSPVFVCCTQVAQKGGQAASVVAVRKLHVGAFASGGPGPASCRVRRASNASAQQQRANRLGCVFRVTRPCRPEAPASASQTLVGPGAR